jgi:sporulation protein YlmC with PRC-barrel domain
LVSGSFTVKYGSVEKVGKIAVISPEISTEFLRVKI